MTAEKQKIRRRDPEATREAILQAAETLFLGRGMAAVPTSAVAKQAGVTKSLIHHYFGSKDALWESVKKRRFEAYFEAQFSLLSNREGSVDLLRESIIGFFRSLQENPEMVRLMSWRSVEDSDPCLEQEAVLFELGSQRIREAQERGDLCENLDPICVIKSFLALCMHWFQTRELLCQLQPLDGPVDELDDLYLENILHIFFHGVLTQEARGATT